MTLELPWPPSINRYYRSLRSGALAGRVLISEEGRTYRKAVDAVVRAQMARKALDMPLSVAIEACPPDRRARDLDNLLKSVLDSLQHAGVYLSDAQIDDLHIRRGPVTKGGRLTVSVAPIVVPGLVTVIDTGWRAAMGDEVRA